MMNTTWKYFPGSRKVQDGLEMCMLYEVIQNLPAKIQNIGTSFTTI